MVRYVVPAGYETTGYLEVDGDGMSDIYPAETLRLADGTAAEASGGSGRGADACEGNLGIGLLAGSS